MHKLQRACVALTFLWGFGAALTITLLPLWEGRKTIAMFWLFITGKRGKDVTDGVHVDEPSPAGSEEGSDKAEGGMTETKV